MKPTQTTVNKILSRRIARWREEEVMKQQTIYQLCEEPLVVMFRQESGCLEKSLSCAVRNEQFIY